MARLSAEQQQNVARLKAQAQKMNAGRKITKALLMGGSVESNYKHLRYGDRDSQGILQQRPSQGWGPASESIEQDAAQFINKAKQVKGAGSAGQLAQAVQRSAFPERYDQKNKEVESLLRGGTPAPAATAARAGTKATPGRDNSAVRSQLLAAYLQNKEKPGALVALASGVRDAADTPGTPGTPAKPAKPAKLADGEQANSIVEAGKIAQKMGLHVGENPAFGGVGGSHKAGGFHYSGQAIDVSGDPKKMAAFNKRMAKMRKKPNELFYDPGINLDRHKPTSPIGGHGDHVHVAID